MGERKESFKLIKNEILRYYQNKKAVDAHKRRIEGLCRRLNEIEQDLEGCNFRRHFETDIKGVAYDGVTVSGGMKESFMEREIERIYRDLEREKVETENQIIMAKNTIGRLERDCAAMEVCLGMLDEEKRNILDMKYAGGKKHYQIAAALNMSESSVNRGLREICGEIAAAMEEERSGEGVFVKSVV